MIVIEFCLTKSVIRGAKQGTQAISCTTSLSTVQLANTQMSWRGPSPYSPLQTAKDRFSVRTYKLADIGEKVLALEPKEQALAMYKTHRSTLIGYAD